MNKIRAGYQSDASQVNVMNNEIKIGKLSSNSLESLTSNDSSRSSSSSIGSMYGISVSSVESDDGKAQIISNIKNKFSKEGPDISRDSLSSIREETTNEDTTEDNPFSTAISAAIATQKGENSAKEAGIAMSKAKNAAYALLEAVGDLTANQDQAKLENITHYADEVVKHTSEIANKAEIYFLGLVNASNPGQPEFVDEMKAAAAAEKAAKKAANLAKGAQELITSIKKEITEAGKGTSENGPKEKVEKLINLLDTSLQSVFSEVGFNVSDDNITERDSINSAMRDSSVYSVRSSYDGRTSSDSFNTDEL